MYSTVETIVRSDNINNDCSNNEDSNYSEPINFLLVGAAVPKLELANPQKNEVEVINLIKQAHDKGVQLLTFPELTLCGVTCGDLFLQPHILQNCKKSLFNIVQSTVGIKMLVFVGIPILHASNVYNCMVAINNGTVISVISKIVEGDELRYFSNPYSHININLCGSNVYISSGIIFSINNISILIKNNVPPNLYNFFPISQSENANVIISPWAYYENIGYDNTNYAKIMSQNKSVYISVNSSVLESTTDYVYNGESIITEHGSILSKTNKYMKKSTLIFSHIDVSLLKQNDFSINSPIFDIDICTQSFPTKLYRNVTQTPFVPTSEYSLQNAINIQKNSLFRRLLHTNSKTAIIGVSGGIDSTLALIVTVGAFEILGKQPKDIIAVTMPGLGTSSKTYNNAKLLIQAVDATFKEISIVNAVTNHFNDIGHDINNKDTTYENAQARERTQILMDLANMHNGLVIGTGCLSEAALGFATYNGDHISMYNPNGGMPKTLEIEVLKYIAKTTPHLSDIILNVLNTPISPELLPTENGEISQKTEEVVGSYVLNDFFIYYFLHNVSQEKICYLAKIAFPTISEEEIKLRLKNFYTRFFNNQYKRSASTDSPSIVGLSLSPRGGYVMPSDVKYFN